jgi:hypothetical protein
MLLFSFFLVSSCQSESIDLPNTTTEAVKTTDAKTPYFNQQVEKNYDAAAEKAIKGRIQNFSDLLKRAENQSLPENSTMNESDVVWNVEALLNSRYGWADKPFSSQITEKDVVIVPRNADGSVDVAALPTAIEQARLKVAARYEAVSGNKHIIAIDIEPKTIESGNLGLEITSVIGEEEELIASVLPLFPFSSAKFGQSHGLLPCESFPATAEFQLEAAINDRFSLSASQRIFATSLQIGYADGRQNLWLNSNNNPYSSNRERYVFSVFGSFTDVSNLGKGCFNSDDMDFFFNSFRDVVLPSLRPTGKVLVHADLIAYQLRHLHATHIWTLTFGEFASCSFQPCYPNGNSSCIICND